MRNDFHDQINALLSPAAQVPVDTVHIFGGQFPAGGLAPFIGAWKLETRNIGWRIWEYTYRIEFTSQPPATPDLALLERARLFGDGGDLTLRRDGDRFLWHFVGGFAPPVAGQKAPEVKLLRRECTALLWGERKGAGPDGRPCWQDDRVGKVKLQYGDFEAARLSVRYTEYSHHGQVAFVWWKELAPYEPGQD